jgi:Tfp pilus assembly protein PilF
VTRPSARIVVPTWFACALVLYAPSLNAPFVFDSTNIPSASLLHITSPGELGRVLFADGVPRRIGLASFALNFYVGGLRPLGYHLVNVLLHAVNACLLYWLSMGILTALERRGAAVPRPRIVAMAAAGLWLVHPVHTQAVSYVYQRFTVLSGTFLLLSLCCWIAARCRSGPVAFALYAAALASAVLALGTKENSATLPALLLLLELGVLRDRPLAWTRKDVALAAFAVVTTLVIAAVYLGPNFVSMMANDYDRRGFTLPERLLTESRVVVYYLSLLLFPHPSRLTLDYDFPLSTGLWTPPTTLAAILVVVVLLWLGVVLTSKHPLVSLSVLWYLGNLVIESTVVPLDLVYEHRLYVPSMMIFLPFTSVLLGHIRPSRRDRLTGIALALLACVWSYWTYQRNTVWADPVRLWEDNASKAPAKARVHANLGAAYAAAGQSREAEHAFEKALELDPAHLGAATSLANLHIDVTEQWSDAERILADVLTRAPGYVPAHVGLGVIRLRTGELEGAVDRFQRALALEPSHQAALYNLGAAYFNMGRYAAAVSSLEDGVSYWPVDARMHALLGAALVELGDGTRARGFLERALELEPDDAMAKRYLSEPGPRRDSR